MPGRFPACGAQSCRTGAPPRGLSRTERKVAIMRTKKVPLRKCTGCGEMKPKKELVRVVKSPEGAISLDLTGRKPGRGAYVCQNIECLQTARKAKRLERAFSCQIPAEVYDQMEEELKASEKS